MIVASQAPEYAFAKEWLYNREVTEYRDGWETAKVGAIYGKQDVGDDDDDNTDDDHNHDDNDDHHDDDDDGDDEDAAHSTAHTPSDHPLAERDCAAPVPLVCLRASC